MGTATVGGVGGKRSSSWPPGGVGVRPVVGSVGVKPLTSVGAGGVASGACSRRRDGGLFEAELSVEPAYIKAADKTMDEGRRFELRHAVCSHENRNR